MVTDPMVVGEELIEDGRQAMAIDLAADDADVKHIAGAMITGHAISPELARYYDRMRKEVRARFGLTQDDFEITLRLCKSRLLNHEDEL